jgi:GT2 family glycosyltransferase
VTVPVVSVIVPTADRPAQLRRCLAALDALDYPRERLEVIVVDDSERHRGPGAARNAGAAMARGEILAFTDDDCRPDRGWLRAITHALGEGGPGTAVGGETLNLLRGNRFAAASQHIQDLVYAHYNRDPAAARFLASNNLAVPRAEFLAVGGFDAARFPFASEDRDFCDRWLASGRTLRYAPGAIVQHAHDLDLSRYVAQHLAYGRGAARFHSACAARGTGRLRDHTSFHLDRSLWLRTLGLRPSRRAVRTASLLILWQVANAAGYALERRSLARRAPHIQVPGAVAVEPEAHDGLLDAGERGLAPVVERDDGAGREMRAPGLEHRNGRVAVVKSVEEEEVDRLVVREGAGLGGLVHEPHPS